MYTELLHICVLHLMFNAVEMTLYLALTCILVEHTPKSIVQFDGLKPQTEWGYESH